MYYLNAGMWKGMFLPFGSWKHTQTDTDLIKQAKISSLRGNDQQIAHDII